MRTARPTRTTERRPSRIIRRMVRVETRQFSATSWTVKSRLAGARFSAPRRGFRRPELIWSASATYQSRALISAPDPFFYPGIDLAFDPSHRVRPKPDAPGEQALLLKPIKMHERVPHPINNLALPENARATRCRPQFRFFVRAHQCGSVTSGIAVEPPEATGGFA